MNVETDAAPAVADARPEAKEGSGIATTPGAQTGTGEPVGSAPGERLCAQLPGDTPAAKIDALHAKHFAGSKLTTDTEAWNLLAAYTADIKRLWVELQEAVEKL